MKTICWIYARVSTSAQGTEGTSLETQIEESKAEIARFGPDYWLDPQGIREEVASGAEGISRPVLEKILEAAEAGLLDLLVVHSPDRLARDHLDIGIVFRRLKKNGVDLHFVNGPASNTPQAEILMVMRGWAAEIEHALITERMGRGIKKLAREGRLPMTSRPYGYDYDRATKTRTINHAEATVVRQIFEMRLAGASTTEISRHLNELGVRTKLGCDWTSGQVLRIIRNSTYTGVSFYGKTRIETLPNGRKRRFLNPMSVWQAQPYGTPPIISTEIFNRINGGDDENPGRTS